MKFIKLGESIASMNTINGYDPTTMKPSEYMRWITSCCGKEEAYNDPQEKRIVIFWDLSLYRDNNQPTWSKTLNQHYKVLEKKIPVTDEQIKDIIQETYSRFDSFLQELQIQTGTLLHPLNNALIDPSHQKIKKLLSHL